MPSLLFGPSRPDPSLPDPNIGHVTLEPRANLKSWVFFKDFVVFQAQFQDFPDLSPRFLQPALQNPSMNLIGSGHDK
jgi:hypothetical protein